LYLLCNKRNAATQHDPFRATRNATILSAERRGLSPVLKGLTTMFLSQLVGVYRQWRRYNQSLRELNRLGDRELADIGLSRADIPRVAWENSER
jgi:uncharacterized protein YjiS (DUF1127 family)